MILNVTSGLLLWCVCLALPPVDATRRVHDFARVLPAETVQSLESLCRQVESETTAQVAVVTVTSLEGKSVESYANSLFNEWGIGQQETNNGVLLLVAPSERRLRIEVGRGLEPLLSDDLCGEIADTYLVPAFKRGEMAGGIETCTQQLAKILLKYPRAAAGIPGSAPLLVRTPQRDAQIGLLVLLLVSIGVFLLGAIAVYKNFFSTVAFAFSGATLAACAAGAVGLLMRVDLKELWVGFGGISTLSAAVLGWNYKRFRRYGPHGCSQCGTPLELLSEQADDEKLSELQRLEEAIGSVDYDVWLCPACFKADTEAYIRYFSGHSQCPKCTGRSFVEGPQIVVRAATQSRTGEAKIEGQCVHCKFKRVRNVTLAKLDRPGSSSSSGFMSSGSSGGSSGGGGSSFGGGSSGGGGASRSW